MTRTDRPDEVPQSRSDKAPESPDSSGRDVLREAGIERCGAFGAASGAQCIRENDHEGPHALEGTGAAWLVKLWRADVERLIAQRDDYKTALREVQDNIRTSAPQAAGRASRFVCTNCGKSYGAEFVLLNGKPCITCNLVGHFELRAAGTAGSVPASGAHHPECSAAILDNADCDCFHGGGASQSPVSGSPTVCTEHNAPRSGCAVCRAQEEEASVAADPSVSDEEVKELRLALLQYQEPKRTRLLLALASLEQRARRQRPSVGGGDDA